MAQETEKSASFSMTLQTSDAVFKVGKEIQININFGNPDYNLIGGIQFRIDLGSDFQVNNIAGGTALNGTGYVVRPSEATMLPSENFRLQQIETKYGVYKTIIQKLNPQLTITLSGYEKLTDEYGKEATLNFFNDEITKLRSKES